MCEDMMEKICFISYSTCSPGHTNKYWRSHTKFVKLFIWVLRLSTVRCFRPSYRHVSNHLKVGIRPCYIKLFILSEVHQIRVPKSDRWIRPAQWLYSSFAIPFQHVSSVKLVINWKFPPAGYCCKIRSNIVLAVFTIISQ